MTQTETAEQETIQLYTADECGPCQQVKDAIKEGNFEVLGLEGQVGIETIDVAEGDNYELVEDLSIEAIPAAYHGLQQCKIFIHEETKRVTFDCRLDGEQQPADEEADEQPTNS